MLIEPALITARVTSILEKLNVRYLIGGSLASTLHGMVRTTQDSDPVAELGLEHVEPFVPELKVVPIMPDGIVLSQLVDSGNTSKI